MYQYKYERRFILAKYKVDISGINTSNLKVLTNEENNQLFLKLKNGDPFARDDLIKGNLKLVLSIIKKLIIRLIIWLYHLYILLSMILLI